jgi:putative membrane protein
MPSEAPPDAPAPPPDPAEGPPPPAEERLHWLTLGFTTLDVARRMIVPALGGGVAAGGGEAPRIALVVLLILSVPGLIGAIIKYVMFRYGLHADELVLRSGLLNRRHRVIPLARVQNVEVRQGLLQRITGVAELRVETAGTGAEAEAVLSVLAAPRAQALRAELLARRRAARTAATPADADAAPAAEPEAADAPEAVAPLAALSTGSLVLAGATANEAGVIAAAAAGLLQFADRIPLPLLERLDPSGLVNGRGVAAVALLVAGVVLTFLLIGWVISIVGAVVRYHGYTLGRTATELRKHYGLLTIHETSVPLHRVQAVRIEESLLRRPLGLATLMIETAGGTPGARGGAEAFVPLASRDQVPGMIRGIFADLDTASLTFHPVHPRSRLRMTRRYLVVLTLLWLPLMVWAWAGGDWTDAVWPALLLPVPFLLATWQYHHRGFALAPGYVVARSGVLNRVTWIVPDRKLQTLHLRETPFQRRLGLTSLVVDTAASGRQAVVMDLGAPTARKLLEICVERMRGTAAAEPGAGAAEGEGRPGERPVAHEQRFGAPPPSAGG